MQFLWKNGIQDAVRQALKEDIGTGDITSLACIPPDAQAKAVLRTRDPLVVCGLDFAVTAFRICGPNLRITPHVQDTESVLSKTDLLTVEGSCRAILTAERVALNFMQRLSGVATWTAQHVAEVRGTATQILDTRKTTPGWRAFEKYAVSCGGGTNHRMGLHDLILIKDNHLAAFPSAKPNPIAAAVQQARRLYPDVPVEVETDTLEQVDQALEAGADIILLDNMSLDLLKIAVEKAAGRARTEASGGITLKNLKVVAATGVDAISIGALTHSAPSVDIALDFETS